MTLADEDIVASTSAVHEANPTTTAVKFDPFILIASSASAICVRISTHPLDTLRIRIQTWPTNKLPAWKVLVPQPRVQTLYAGLPVALAISIPALSIYLTTYEFTKKYLGTQLFSELDSKPTLLQQLPVFALSGMAAEFASGALWTVSDVLKSRLQRGGEGERNISATTLLKKIWKEEGGRGVFRGYFVSMVVFVPYISLYWTLYESFKTTCIQDYNAYRPSSSSSLPNNNVFSIPLTLQYTLCSVTACSLAASITTPIELVQARWQTSAGKGVENGVIGIVKDLWKQGGARAFSRGLGIRVAYAIPANGISMTVYESLKRYRGI